MYLYLSRFLDYLLKVMSFATGMDICNNCDPNDLVCSSVCNQFHNCPISINVLYNFARVAASYRFFTTGIGTTIQDKAGFLAARLGFYQQIPWLIAFVFLVIFVMVIHFFVMDLDVLWARVARRLPW